MALVEEMEKGKVKRDGRVLGKREMDCEEK